MVNPNKVIAATAIMLVAGALGSMNAFATDQSIIRRSGFSETRIPQVNGRVPIKKSGTLEKGTTAKTAAKPGQSGNAQGGAATCGPDNAQSEFCRKK
ncbi:MULTISPECIES: hypothetical protein [unclassified Rhizobium]|uniref:hypothetical protein n=1 Tax=unclassified Rhizobium TaxID=2613769 RepID=UPI000EAA401A|nr:MULTISPECIES: hypothetical protein [unclassified Rhizobium]AYG69921.1 hypothetical protein CCGE531_28000 [Rhizobium sp. CCGE531]AYG76298.1 hypothetical protein CCGE532_27475 [Rhizobium sp. CCGE532]